MKIAVATEAGQVAPHFGRCPEYTLFDVEGDKVLDQRVIANPGHEPGFLPEYLAKLGVNCIIAGGMGPRAEQLFAEQQIATVIGATGPTEEVVSAYIKGTLVTGLSACQHETESENNCSHHPDDHS